MALCEKYRPTTLDETCLTPPQRQYVRKWIEGFVAPNVPYTNEHTRALCFIGPSGVGKTAVALAMLNEYGYSVREFNSSHTRNKQFVAEHFSAIIGMRSPFQRRPPAILMDEIESMVRTDRTGIEEMFTYVSMPGPRKKKKVIKELKQAVPIVCICNTGNIKKELLDTLERECSVVHMGETSRVTTRRTLTSILEKEGAVYDAAIVNMVEKQCTGNLLNAITTLEYLMNCGVNLTSVDDVSEALMPLASKYQSLYVSKAVESLMNKRLSDDELYQIYLNDKSKSSMLVYENYGRALDVNCTGRQAGKRLETAACIIDSFTYYDRLERMVYRNQTWVLPSVQELSSLHAPTLHIYKHHSNLSKHVSVNWPSVLSKNAQAQNLKKCFYQETNVMFKDRLIGVSDFYRWGELLMYRTRSSLDLTAFIADVKRANVITGEDLEQTKKSIVLTLDKISKYLKQSAYYIDWEAFILQNKNDRDLDAKLRDSLKQCVPLKLRQIKDSAASTSVVCVDTQQEQEQEQEQEQATRQLRRKPVIVAKTKTAPPQPAASLPKRKKIRPRIISKQYKTYKIQ